MLVSRGWLPADLGDQTIWLSCLIRSIAPRQNASMSRRAMRTASARTKPRSNAPVRNHESRLTTTRIITRTIKIVKSLLSRSSALSIVSHADGAVDTIESNAIPSVERRERERIFRL
jgi:hypothetical protein